MHYTTGGITIKIAFQGVQGTICRYQILHPVKKRLLQSSRFMFKLQCIMTAQLIFLFFVGELLNGGGPKIIYIYIYMYILWDIHIYVFHK